MSLPPPWAGALLQGISGSCLERSDLQDQVQKKRPLSQLALLAVALFVIYLCAPLLSLPGPLGSIITFLLVLRKSLLTKGSGGPGLNPYTPLMKRAQKLFEYFTALQGKSSKSNSASALFLGIWVYVKLLLKIVNCSDIVFKFSLDSNISKRNLNQSFYFILLKTIFLGSFSWTCVSH